MSETTHECALGDPPAAARQFLEEAAEAWGGSLESADGAADDTATLVIPVVAGLRRGFVAGPVHIERRGEGSHISFRVSESHFRVDLPSAITLLFGAFGALITLVVPFFPQLWQLVPAGVMLSIGAWLFIVARLRNSGPEEFFEDLATAEEPPGE